jgi:hypothetical protein
MQHDTKLEALLRKIRALKAKAEDKGTTEAESLAFAAKVAELLAQHGLEEAQLSVEEQTGVSHEDYVSDWNTSPYRRALAIAVCRLYMVSPLIRSKKGSPWTLVGRQHNIIMVKEMAAYLIKTTIRLSNAYGKINPKGVVDFRRGCFKRLTERVLELREEQARKAAPEYTPQGNPGNLPALYRNETQLAAAYISQHYGKTGTYKQRSGKYGADAIAGRAAGDSISFNTQVGGGRSNHLLGGKK